MKRNKHAGTASKFKIGAHIRKWRNIRDIKQKDLAMALQISEAAVSNIENDVSNLTIGQLEEISLVLNVSIEQLLSDPQDKFNYPQYAAQINNVNDDPSIPDKALLNALIVSIEKKDQQLHIIMQHFLQTITSILHNEKPMINSSKQATSRV